MRHLWLWSGNQAPARRAGNGQQRQRQQRSILYRVGADHLGFDRGDGSMPYIYISKSSSRISRSKGLKERRARANQAPVSLYLRASSFNIRFEYNQWYTIESNDKPASWPKAKRIYFIKDELNFKSVLNVSDFKYFRLLSSCLEYK